MSKPAIALKKILLVDPDARALEKSALRLSILEVEVLKAASMAEALVILETATPHLIVMDWPLPGGKEAGVFEGKLRMGLQPVVYCGSPSAAGVPTPSWAGHVFVSKQDRQELIDQVSRLLEGKMSSPPGIEERERRAKSPRQILVIEDSPTLRGIIRRALEKAFPLDVIREAGEGKQALSEMSQKKVDLIVTDLEMPGMDGFTFLNHLKSSPLLSKKPVLIFSGKISPELKEQAASLPRVRFLDKPADPEKIAAEVSALFEI